MPARARGHVRPQHGRQRLPDAEVRRAHDRAAGGEVGLELGEAAGGLDGHAAPQRRGPAARLQREEQRLA